MLSFSDLNPDSYENVVIFATNYYDTPINKVARQTDWFYLDNIQSIYGHLGFFQKRNLSDKLRTAAQPIQLWCNPPQRHNFCEFRIFQKLSDKFSVEEMRAHVRKVNQRFNTLMETNYGLAQVQHVYFSCCKNILHKKDKVDLCDVPDDEWSLFKPSEESLFSADDMSSGLEDGFPLFNEEAPCKDKTGLNNIDTDKMKILNTPGPLGVEDDEDEVFFNKNLFIQTHHKEREVTLLMSKKLEQHLYYLRQITKLFEASQQMELPKEKGASTMFLRRRNRKESDWTAPIIEVCKKLMEEDDLPPTLLNLYEKAAEWEEQVLEKLKAEHVAWLYQSQRLLDSMKASQTKLYKQLAAEKVNPSEAIAKPREQDQTYTTQNDPPMEVLPSNKQTEVNITTII